MFIAGDLIECASWLSSFRKKLRFLLTRKIVFQKR